MEDKNQFWLDAMRGDAAYIRQVICSGKCEVIICDNVSEMYFGKEREFSDGSFPNAIPPFAHTFCEFVEYDIDGSARNFQAGCFVQSMDLKNGFLGSSGEVVRSVVLMASHEMFEALGRNEHTVAFHEALEKSTTRFCTRYTWVFYAGHGAVVMPLEVKILLNDVGEVAAKLFMAHPCMRWDKGTYQSAHIPRLAFTLMSCKNVSAVDVSANMLPDEKWQRRQAGKIKGLTFKTLKIDGMGSGQRKPSGEPSGAHNSFHICRGNSQSTRQSGRCSASTLADSGDLPTSKDRRTWAW
jgi:hypothetical protein